MNDYQSEVDGATHIGSDNDHQIEGSSINDLGEALSPPSTNPKAHQAIGPYQEASPYLKTLLLNIWCYVFKTAVSLLKMTHIHYTLSKIMSSTSNLEEIEHGGIIRPTCTGLHYGNTHSLGDENL